MKHPMPIPSFNGENLRPLTFSTSISAETPTPDTDGEVQSLPNSRSMAVPPARPSIEDGDEDGRERPVDPTMLAAFLDFHAKHPDVYEHLKRLALQMRGIGRRHYNIATLYENVRLHHDTTAHKGKSSIRLNNNHRAFYARKLMDEVPELDGMFRTRVQRRAA